MEGPKECSRYRYRKTMDEVILTCTKHNKTSVVLKQTVENQKTKINEFCEVRSKIQDDIDNLEDDISEM